MENARLSGEVRWHHVARSRAIKRIIERAIARWVALHQLASGAAPWAVGASKSKGSDEPRYRAVLQREGDGHLVHCQIEVVAQGRSWVGSRIGSGIQQALSECLAHMSPVAA